MFSTQSEKNQTDPHLSKARTSLNYSLNWHRNSFPGSPKVPAPVNRTDPATFSFLSFLREISAKWVDGDRSTKAVSPTLKQRISICKKMIKIVRSLMAALTANYFYHATRQSSKHKPIHKVFVQYNTKRTKLPAFSTWPINNLHLVIA